MRNVQIETAGDSSRDYIEALVDLGMGSIARITVTDKHVEWQFMEAGSAAEQIHRVIHYEAKGRGISL